MPGRKVPLVTNEIYHVFNRGIDRRPTFTTKREYTRALDTISFYRFKNQTISLSRFFSLNQDFQKKYLSQVRNSAVLINILSFCLMPNHFHFLLKQTEDNGIAKFMSNIQNSYTRFFNTKHNRDGALFLDQFKAVRIETDEQLVHVDRYIHLNPYSTYVVSSKEQLLAYPWSSLSLYLNGKNEFVETTQILKYFPNIQKYQKFILDQADYQRELKRIQHLILE